MASKKRPSSDGANRPSKGTKKSHVLPKTEGEAPCIAQFQLTADSVFTMIRYLAESTDSTISIDSSSVYRPSDADISPEDMEKIRNSTFHTVFKDFSPNLQYKLSGIDNQSYWLTPEVVQAIRFFRNENFEIADTPLPGEITSPPSDRSIFLSMQSPFDNSLPNTNGVTTVTHNNPCKITHIPFVSGCSAMKPLPSIPLAAGVLAFVNYKSPSEEECAPEIKQLANEGFVFNQRITRLMVRMACWCDSPVILIGPTGSGKSRLAKLLHRCYYDKTDPPPSNRKHPFIEVNCATLHGDNTKAEIFGHPERVFTGIPHAHAGYLAQANGGSLFFDEFEELSTEIQAMLLTSFDAADPLVHTYEQAMGNKTQTSHFRLMVATNVDLNTLLESKKLREDFRSRLGPVIINMPNLDRQSHYFLKIFWDKVNEISDKNDLSYSITDDARSKLETWLIFGQGVWSGNMRDMVHCAATLLNFAKMNNGIIQSKDIDDLIVVMQDYWKNTALSVNPDGNNANKPIMFDLDYRHFFEQVYGKEIANRIDSKDYVECYELTITNFICGSAKRAGECYFNNNATSNPSKQMTDILIKMKLLDKKDHYKQLFKKVDKNLINELKNPKNIELVHRIIKTRPPNDDLDERNVLKKP